MTVCEDIRSYLISNNLGTTSNVFCYNMPTTPDAAISVREYQGRPTDLIANIEQPQVNIICRALTGLAARQKADDIVTLLHTMNEVTISGTRYLYANATSNPIYAGIDRNQRFLYSLNFRIVKERET